MLSRIASLVSFGIAACAIGLLAFRNNLISQNPFGLIVQALAVGLMVWARLVFGKRSFHAGANPTAGGLVTRGPYRFLRHPIYAAVIYFVSAGVVSFPSAEAITLAIIVVLCLGVRMLLEERFLIAAYPEYREYCKKAKRLVPYLL